MEKYGQYRDKGSGIAPFFPISPPPTSPLWLPWHIILVCFRFPLITFAWIVWLVIIQWLPAGSVLRKANQWCLLGIPGVWWIDLQVDGVRRGSLAQTPKNRLPHPGTIIASSYTSPLDVLYLAAIFDPIFTQSVPNSKLVRPISQESALAACFCVQNPFSLGSKGPKQLSLTDLMKQNPSRIIVVFPEGTTSNGRGILRLSPSLLSAPSNTKIFPVSLRYTPPDVVTPIPGWVEALRFIWRLNSSQSHCIRVRIGGAISMAQAASRVPTLNTPSPASKQKSSAVRNGFESNYFDTLQASPAQKVAGDDEDEDGLTLSEKKALDAIADDLARLGRVKPLALGMEEKGKFVDAWRKGSKSRK
ncbi:vacuolar protein sorting protein vps66 [Teratosphaeria destructans]|uniref:Vacuolar protein sorting protein vps66 n=1 Tax=Teratosphaeria destructans TaxID=418781 RepID=A0A9W7SM08_9PEZI|nr:vacuolar protein sorting protein vps66 [Teratosphaeria destructans]